MEKEEDRTIVNQCDVNKLEIFFGILELFAARKPGQIIILFRSSLCDQPIQFSMACACVSLRFRGPSDPRRFDDHSSNDQRSQRHQPRTGQEGLFISKV